MSVLGRVNEDENSPYKFKQSSCPRYYKQLFASVLHIENNFKTPSALVLHLRNIRVQLLLLVSFCVNYFRFSVQVYFFKRLFHFFFHLHVLVRVMHLSFFLLQNYWCVKEDYVKCLVLSSCNNNFHILAKVNMEQSSCILSIIL